MLQKFEEEKDHKEVEKGPPKELEVLTIYTKRIDKNSLYALRVALPVSKIHTVHFANNNFVAADFEILVDCIVLSPIIKAFIDWNPVAKNEDPEKDSPFARL